jgi:hypothetical protein
MNERIKQLAAQCWDLKLDGVRHFDQEQFAELIISECAEVCLAQRDPANLNYKPSVKFAEAINQHFGVRE